MIVLVGESGSGKSTVEKLLIEQYDMKPIVSYTTRPMRKGEKDGVDYHFVTDEKFAEMKRDGLFLETGEYNSWHYGSLKEDYKDDSVAVLTPHGMRQLSKLRKVAFIVYIKIPRRDRLIKILQRGDNIEESYRRNVSDIGQFDGIEDEVDYVICNNNYEKSPKSLARTIYARYNYLMRFE